MTNYKDIKRIPIVAADVPNLDTAKITTGTFANARIAEASVTQHVTATDLQPIKSDISALALREATNESSAAFNLPNQFIDTFATDTLGTKTNSYVSGGYVASTSLGIGKFADDSYTSFLLHSDTTDGSTTFTDSSSNGHTITNVGSITHSTNFKKTALGATSIKANGSGGLYVPADAGWQFGTGDFTIEFWQYTDGSANSGDRILSFGDSGSNEIFFRPKWNQSQFIQHYISSGSGWSSQFGSEPASDTWVHLAFVRDGNIFRFYKDGVHQTFGSYPLTTTGSMFTGSLSLDVFAQFYPNTPGSGTEHANVNIYLTELRVSKGICRYPSGTTFTPNNVQTINATGTAIQAANTVGSAKTKVGGTMLYKDLHGTATLGTDLKIYFTCNGGTNWTEASSYSAITPVYSTGVKQVRLGETTCTSGTDVRYKAVWANQAASSKETQLHGIGVNY